MGFRKEWLCAIPFPPLEIFFGFFFRKFIHRFLEGVKPLPYTVRFRTEWLCAIPFPPLGFFSGFSSLNSFIIMRKGSSPFPT